MKKLIAFALVLTLSFALIVPMSAEAGGKKGPGFGTIVGGVIVGNIATDVIRVVLGNTYGQPHYPQHPSYPQTGGVYHPQPVYVPQQVIVVQAPHPAVPVGPAVVCQGVAPREEQALQQMSDGSSRYVKTGRIFCDYPSGSIQVR